MKLTRLKKIIIPVTCLWILVVSFSACKKRKLDKETTTSEDNAAAQQLFDDVFNVTDKFDDTESDMDGENKTGMLNDTCYTHSLYSCLEICKDYIDIANRERTITFDFGTTGCATGDGRNRTGKVIAHRTGRYLNIGSTTVITTDGYTVDGYAVDGTKTITNRGKNALNQQQYSVVVSGEITTPDGDVITWNSSRTRTWVEGADTWIFGSLNADGSIDSLYWIGVDGIYDDVWEITGNGDGINRNGRAFDIEITSALRVQWCQPHIEVTQGVVELQPQDLTLRLVDFGDGTCDNKAVATIGNNDYEFNIRGN